MGAELSLAPRALAWGALRFLLAHLALLAAWPLAGTAYAPLYRAGMQLATGVLDPLPGAIEVRFEPGSGGVLAEDLVAMDTVVSLRPRDLGGEPAALGASSFFHGYFPTTVLIALLAASFGTWRGRRMAPVASLLLLHAWLLVRCLPALFYCYSQCTIDGRSPLGLGPFGLRVLFMLRHFTWTEALPNYLLPLGIVALCVFGPRSSARPPAGSAAR